jgi:hypothetical protein
MQPIQLRSFSSRPPIATLNQQDNRKEGRIKQALRVKGQDARMWAQRMPLCSHALTLICANLEAINGHRPSRNQMLPQIVAEVIFIGNHTYQSRVVRDGYSIDDGMDQIAGAMSEASMLVGNLPMQAIENPVTLGL